MKFLIALSASAMVSLSACQPAETQAEAPSAPQVPAPPQVSSEPSTGVLASGVGPITAETPFTVEAVQALFPTSDVRAEFLHEGEDATPIITVAGPDEIALELQGDAGGVISQALVQGGSFTGPDGEVLLAAWPELGLAAADCRMGEGRFTGQPVCSKAAAANIAYILSVPGLSGSTLPDPTTLNGRARLVGWLWTRP